MSNSKLSVEPAALGLAPGGVTVRVIGNLAYQHLRTSIRFRDIAIALERSQRGPGVGDYFSEIGSYATGCVMFSSASLEALINELFLAHGGRLRTSFKPEDFENKFWGHPSKPGAGIERMTPILLKYQHALERLDRPKIDPASPQYRAATALFELRNAFMHFKPLWDPARDRQVRLMELLDGRYELSPHAAIRSDFVTEKSMSAGCVIWAVDTVFAFLHAFDSTSDIDPNKMAGFWALEQERHLIAG